MKTFRAIMVTLLIGLITLVSVSCSSSDASSTTTTTTTYTVKTGNILSAVTGTGNLAYSASENLAFEMDGTVDEILVETSESVKAGQELAKLDTSTWDEKLKTLSKAVTTAQRNLITAQTAVTTAQKAVATKEMAVKSAEMDLQVAQYNLDEIAEIKTAQDKVDQAKAALDYAIAMKAANDNSITYQYIYGDDGLQAQYDLAVANLNKVIKGTDTTISTSVALQISQDQLKVEQAQAALTTAQNAVTDARTAVTEAQSDEADAEQAVKDAQADLDEANKLSPVITAPFDGIITAINVKGGDDIYKGTVAVQIADPNKFEANILVTETDIFSVKVGGESTVTVDAISGVSYPATITEIAPLATVSSGVVNYQVTAQLTDSDKVSTLKSGLSATVNVIIAQKNDVLIVPTRAITHVGQNATVQVVNGTVTEVRTIQTGISDSSNTEVTSGLTAGEVILTKSSSSTKTSTSNQGGPGMVPGIGGMP